MALTFGAALAITGARERAVEGLRAAAPRIKVWSGALLLLIGAWTLALAAFADFFAGVFPV